MEKIIAIDFDGTLCTNAWPDIGQPIRRTIHRAKKEQARGAKLTLWTCREGRKLNEALEWCGKHGLYFDWVNENAPERIEVYGNDCRKIGADEYWDDKGRVIKWRLNKARLTLWSQSTYYKTYRELQRLRQRDTKSTAQTISIK